MPEKTARTSKPFEGKIPQEVLEHMHAAKDEMRKSIEGIVPPGFLEHRRNARKEMLLAWRSMIDASLKRMDEREKSG
jgi:hypothetical protein